MADETDDKTWIADLECALSEECGGGGVEGEVAVPEGLRPEMWKSWLATTNQPPAYFDEIFDLPEQNLLRQDCHQFVAKLGNDDEDKVSVLSDLESILTYHRKRLGRGGEYTSGNGWLELLQPLIALKLPRSETCTLFQAVASKYVPRGTAAYPLFRLLVLYHDPKLCSFLDTMRITPDKYAATWFQSLFAATCSLPAVTAIWDLYFQQADPFFLLFLGLVIVINSSVQITSMKDQPKEKIIEALISLPCGLQVNDVQDFCSLAQYYSSKTPGSFRQDLESVLFDDCDGEPLDNLGKCQAVKDIEQALCLPVSVRELVDNISLAQDSAHHRRHIDDDQDGGDGVTFFLVDCRPADQYNAGHLPTAFHLDCNLMLQGGEVFNTAVQALLSSKRQALAANSSAGGEHLCFMGCGSLQSDQYTHMVVASFLHSNTHYVTLLTGGYKSLHEYFGESIDSMLADHNSLSCVVCLENTSVHTKTEQKNGIQSPSRDFLGKIGAAVKLKSAEVKVKLLEYIVNPGGSTNNNNNNNGAEFERHVSPTDKIGKRYRNMAPVFSIDDDQEPPQDADYGEGLDLEDSQFEEVSMSSWMKRPDILEKFHCKELRMNGDIYESELLVSSTHVYVLRPTGKKDRAKLVVRRPLSAIAKITCKKQHRDIITFKYGAPEGDSLKISDVDTFQIPKASEATKVISEQINKMLEKKEEENRHHQQQQQEQQQQEEQE